MSRLRWALFAAMARLELPEDVYLRIPGAQRNRRAPSLLSQFALRFREHRNTP